MQEVSKPIIQLCKCLCIVPVNQVNEIDRRKADILREISIDFFNPSALLLYVQLHTTRFIGGRMPINQLFAEGSDCPRGPAPAANAMY